MRFLSELRYDIRIFYTKSKVIEVLIEKPIRRVTVLHHKTSLTATLNKEIIC